MTSQDVFEIVQQSLDKSQPRNYRLDATTDGMQESGNWWYVVVRPSKPDIPANDYAHRMARIENAIERERGIKVLLIPSLVD